MHTIEWTNEILHGAHKGFVICVLFKSMIEGITIVITAQKEIKYLAYFDCIMICGVLLTKKYFILFETSQN